MGAVAASALVGDGNSAVRSSHSARPQRDDKSGPGEIRTHETLAGLPVFKTGAFNRSATGPCARGRRRCSGSMEVRKPRLQDGNAVSDVLIDGGDASVLALTH